MNRPQIVLLVLGFGALATYALAEDITVATFYPSPRGVYNQLRTMGRTTLAETGGNVGIGTGAPNAGYSLHIVNGSNAPGRAMIDVEATAENAYLLLTTDAYGLNPTGIMVKRGDSGLLKINNANDSSVNHLVIDNAGNVGIGTVAPAAKLEVIGNIIAATPTAGNHVATKAYVDAAGGATVALQGIGAAPPCPAGWTEIVGQTAAGSFQTVTNINSRTIETWTGITLQCCSIPNTLLASGATSGPVASDSTVTTYTFYYRVCKL